MSFQKTTKFHANESKLFHSIRYTSSFALIHMIMILLFSGTCVEATGTEMAGPMESPDSGKKRPRKSHPQRVVVESDTGNIESDSEMEMPDEADIPDGGNSVKWFLSILNQVLRVVLFIFFSKVSKRKYGLLYSQCN